MVSENKGGLGDLIKKNYGSAEECQIAILQVILIVKILPLFGQLKFLGYLPIAHFPIITHLICFRTSLSMLLMDLEQITSMMQDPA